MLFGYPVLDNASYRLNEYFLGAVHDLDEAAGTSITIIYIGDPEQCGAIHRELRSPRLKREDARDARKYVNEVHNTGRERFHRLGAMKELEKGLGLSPEDVPCIAFLTRRGRRPIGILHVQCSWYDTPLALKGFDHCFRSWLGRDDVKRLARSDLGDSKVAAKLGPLLSALSAEISNSCSSGGPCARPSDPGRRPTSANSFYWDGESWKIRWQDVDLPLIRDLSGLRLIHYLIQHEGEISPVLDLLARTLDQGKAGDRKEPPSAATVSELTTDSGFQVSDRLEMPLERADSATLRDLRARLEKLEEIKTLLEGSGGQASQELLDEIEQIRKYMIESFNVGGEPRRIASEIHKARVRVNKAIKIARERIRGHCPDLGAHLDGAVRVVNASYSYRPDRRMDWALEPPVT